jgi:hypothetical protein
MDRQQLENVIIELTKIIEIENETEFNKKYYNFGNNLSNLLVEFANGFGKFQKNWSIKVIKATIIKAVFFILTKTQFVDYC